MHIYLAHVLAQMFHGDPLFSRYFYIRSYLPPYSLFYYFLMVLTKLFSIAMAEKVIVCSIFCVQATGFRFLARSVGPSGVTASFWIFPLLLNWPLGMGFMNFELSLGMGFWALGFWWHIRDRFHLTYAIGFLALIAVMMITHPVPILFVLGTAWLVLLVSIVSDWFLTRTWEGAKQRRRATAVLAMASCSMGYIAHFTDHTRVSQAFLTGAAPVMRLAKLRTLGYFPADTWATDLYRAGLYLLLLGCFISAVTDERKSYWTGGAREWNWWLLFVPLLTCIILVIPSDMNGSHFFSDRLVLLVWISAILATSVRRAFSASNSRLNVAAATCATLCVILLGNARIRPLSQAIMQQQAAPFPEASGSAGILLGKQLNSSQTAVQRLVTFDPFEWNAAYHFTRSDTVLLNPPWLDLPIMQLGTKAGMLNRTYSPHTMDEPENLFSTLVALTPEGRQQVLDTAHFVLVGNLQEAKELGLGSGWDLESDPSFVLCTRR